MKAIFLCETERTLREVYSPAVTDQLAALCTLDGAVYTKADLGKKDFREVEAVFSTWGMPSLTEDEIRTRLPALKYVFYAAGSVQAFARPFLCAGVRIFSAAAANAVPVAEYTVAQILLAGKDFYRQSRLHTEGHYDDTIERRGPHFGNYRKRVGLIGCGQIGSLVAKMLAPFELSVCVYDPFLPAERARVLGVTPCSLEELFATCSVLSNHLADNVNTKKMLTYKLFASMPPYATFLNTGRGAQVVEEDLVRALSERDDLTAVLDVTDPEPSPADHPFFSLPNCFLTPHIAGSLGGEVVRMAEYMRDALEAVSAGGACPYEVTQKMLETMA